MSDAAAQLKALKGKVQQGISKGVLEGAEAVRAAAIPLTPLGETGNLRGSSTINPILQQAGITSTVLHYAIVYARYQHQGHGFNFRTPGTGAGFLKTAADTNRQVVKQIITNHIKGAM